MTKPTEEQHAHVDADGKPYTHSHVADARRQTPESGVAHTHARTYRGFVPRPPRPGVKLFHGIVASMPSQRQERMAALLRAHEAPFVGLTTDGQLVRNLFKLEQTGVSTKAVVAAARTFLAGVSDEDRRRQALQPLDSPYRRRWINAYPDWVPPGLYLDDASAAERDAAMTVIAASLSAKGFADTRRAMKFNGLLGEFVGIYRDTLREWAYWFTIFGDPSPAQPWGWQLMGHHLDLNCFFLGDQMVLAPTFLGSEMCEISDGPLAGERMFVEEQERGLEFARSLTPVQQERAILYRSMLSKDLPSHLAGLLDGRCRAGAGRDNSILPYEGVRADSLSRAQQDLLTRVIQTYVYRMPDGHRELKMAEVQKHFHDTHFSWIGNPETNGPFYYKIHNPVVLIEFDHHTGIFLSNDEPEPFHIHTIVRTPNGNDYGMDLLRLHYERSHGGHRP